MHLYTKSSILPEFIVDINSNLQAESIGMDSFDECLDKGHYSNYPFKIQYNFNDRGFRDEPWPLSKLKNCVWCLGDSFTVGLGSPLSHTWPYILQKKLNLRTINVSMNGASNTWIARKTIQIIENIRPKCIVIHWSYLHRREDEDESLSDEGRILHQQYNTFEEDYLLLGNQIQSITTFANKYGTKILHSFIPLVVSKIDTKLFSSVLVDMKIVQENYIVLDIARDGHHYGIKTAEMFTDSIVKSFQNI